MAGHLAAAQRQTADRWAAVSTATDCRMIDVALVGIVDRATSNSWSMQVVDEISLLSPFAIWLWCHDDPAPSCDVYWGSHGCHLIRGHDGPCLCECAWEWDLDLEDDYVKEGLAPHMDDPHHDTGNVGRPPYYGPDTTFFGDDVHTLGLPTFAR